MGAEWDYSINVDLRLGITPWDDPTSSDIKASASAFAQSLPTIKSFIFDSNSTYSQLTYNRIDMGIWVLNSQTLLLATNLNYNAEMLDLENLPVHGSTVRQFFQSGSAVDGLTITFESVGSGAFVLS